MKLIDKLKFDMYIFAFLLVLSLSMPLAALIIPWRPEHETLCSWFQRSGSLMVVFSLLAEAKALNFHSSLFPRTAFGNSDAIEAKKQYWHHPKIMGRLSFVFIAIGTFIWGYGDIIIKNT